MGLVAVPGLVIGVIKRFGQPPDCKTAPTSLDYRGTWWLHHDLTAYLNPGPPVTKSAPWRPHYPDGHKPGANGRHRSKNARAFTYSVAHDLKGPHGRSKGSSLLENDSSKGRCRNPPPHRCHLPFVATPHPYDRRAAAQIFAPGATGPRHGNGLMRAGDDHDAHYRPPAGVQGPKPKSSGRSPVR